MQNAIEKAAAAGGGKVVLAPGTHRSGTIYLRDNVELHLPAGSRLLGGTEPEEYDDLPAGLYGEYAPCKCSKTLVAASGAVNIAITGSGVIEGGGPAFYDRDRLEGGFFYAKTEKPRPRLLQLVHCRNVRLEGVTFLDSPGWTTWLIECEDVTITGLRIYGDPRMINNDGLHFFGGKRIAVSNCFISTGDDALVVRAGRAWQRDAECLAENVVVTNCVLESSCQGVRLGCTCDDKIRRCSFSNLIIRSRNVGIYLDNPVRYLTVACKGPLLDLDDVSFENISVESLTKPIAVEVEEGLVAQNRPRPVSQHLVPRAGAALFHRLVADCSGGDPVVGGLRLRFRTGDDPQLLCQLADYGALRHLPETVTELCRSPGVRG